MSLVREHKENIWQLQSNDNMPPQPDNQSLSPNPENLKTEKTGSIRQTDEGKNRLETASGEPFPWESSDLIEKNKDLNISTRNNLKTPRDIKGQISLKDMISEKKGQKE